MSQEELMLYMRQLRSENPSARYCAALYLEQAADPASVPALIEVFGGDDIELMGAAARALGSIGAAAAAAVPTLTEALNHDELWVGKCAEYALERIEGR